MIMLHARQKWQRVSMLGKLALLYLCLKLIRQLRLWASKRHSMRRLKSPEASASLVEHPLYSQFLQNRQGLWLFTKKWLPNSDTAIKGVVFIVHGLGEHIQRYETIARMFNARGLAVYGLDHQGHGQSEGDRLFVEKFNDFATDYLDYIDKVLDTTEWFGVDQQCRRVKLSDLPRFLLGHSMGGAITLAIAERSVGRFLWNGIVLSGPALKVEPAVATPTTVALSKMLSQILPKMPVNSVDSALVSRDPVVQERYMRDPMVSQTGCTARLAAEMLLHMPRLMNLASTLTNQSFFLVHGSDDKIVMPEGSVEFYHECKSEDVDLKMYPQLYHELLNSMEFETVFRDIVEWMEERLEKRGAFCLPSRALKL